MSNKTSILEALSVLDRVGNDKQKIDTDDNKESWRGKPPIPIMGGASVLNDYAKDLDKEGDLDDEEILRAFAGLVFSKLKDYPQLLQEIKDTYFK